MAKVLNVICQVVRRPKPGRFNTLTPRVGHDNAKDLPTRNKVSDMLTDSKQRPDSEGSYPDVTVPHPELCQ